MAGVREATVTDVQGIAHVHAASWRTSYTSLIPESFLDSRNAAYREQMWQGVLSNPENPTRLYVAVDEQDAIVGFVAGGPNRDEQTYGYDGELYAIYLLDTAQGKGYGKALTRTIAERLRDEGFSSMILWVFEQNPRARRFYEAMGGILVPGSHKEFTLEDRVLVEVAYGWRNLEAVGSR